LKPTCSELSEKTRNQPSDRGPGEEEVLGPHEYEYDGGEVQGNLSSDKEEAQAETEETSQKSRTFVACGASIALGLKGEPNKEESGTSRTGLWKKVTNNIVNSNTTIERGTEVNYTPSGDKSTHEENPKRFTPTRYQIYTLKEKRPET
jgi:hypothetical protein